MKQITQIVDSSYDLILNDQDIVLKTNIQATKESTHVLITDVFSKQVYECIPSNLSTPVVATVDELFTWLSDALDIGKNVNITNASINTNATIQNSSLDVALQDQTTDPLILKFHQHLNDTMLVNAVNIGDRTVTLADSTSAQVGRYLILFDVDANRFSEFTIVGWADPVATLCRPIDYAYPAGSIIEVASTDMAVNGSVTPQIFGLREPGVHPNIDYSYDITQIVVTCESAHPVNLTLFGDLTALTNGLVLRKRDGRYFNVLNTKSNFDFANMYDYWAPYDKTRPWQGQDGFSSGLRFGGQGNMGVVLRVSSSEDIEFIVQDDLSGLTKLEVIAKGHIVMP